MLFHLSIRENFMRKRDVLAAFVFGFALSEGFNGVSNPFGHVGFVDKVKSTVENPAAPFLGIVFHAESAAPLAIAAVAGSYLIASAVTGRKRKDEDGPQSPGPV
jgi:hypothetical protein